MTAQHPSRESYVGIRHVCIHNERMEFHGLVVMTELDARLKNEQFCSDQRPYRWYTEREAVKAIVSTAPLDLPVPPVDPDVP